MLMSLSLSTTAFGQQSMTETQILQYVMQQKKLGKAESDIAQDLLKKGATLEQIQKMREKYASQLEKTGMGQAADKALGDASDRMRKNNGALREVEMDDQSRQMRQQQMMMNRPDGWPDGVDVQQRPDDDGHVPDPRLHVFQQTPGAGQESLRTRYFQQQVPHL